MASRASLYFDVMVSNERKAVVAVRPLTPDSDASTMVKHLLWWTYEVKVGSDTHRGTVEWTHDIDKTPLDLVARVMEDHHKNYRSATHEP